MSFFSKMSKEMGGLLNDMKDKKPEGGNEQARGYDQQPYSQYNTPPPGQYGAPQQYGNQPQYAPSQQYNAPQQYGAPQPYNAPQYNTPPPQNQPYNSPPQQQYGSSPAPPQVPQGWLPLWDPAGQRWAYLEYSNNTVIWTTPTGPSLGQGANRGFGDSYGNGQYGAPPNNGSYGAPVDAQKKSDKSGMLMGAAGGLAVGAIGGALIANAMDDDDHHDEGEHAPPAQAPMDGPLPDETRDGDSVSSSDREDVEEARERYEEAYEETYDD